MSDLTVRDLGTLFDGPHATPTRMDTGPYFLNIASLNEGRLDLAQSDHVSEVDFKKWTKRVEPAEGDLLFSYETRLGEAALMPADVRACLGRRMALIRPNRSVVNPKFLLYYYLSPGFQRTIEQHTIHGATVNRISLSTMGAWPVRLPSLPEQRAIAEVLSALDDKIAANTKLIATTDDLCASLVYRASTSGTFCQLSEVASVKSGYTFKSKDWQETGVPVVKIGNIKPGVVDLDGCSFVSDAVALDAASYRLHDKDILIAMTGYVGEVARHRGQASVLLNQRVGRFAITDPDRLTADYLYYFLRLAHVKATFIAKGQGSAQQNIGAGDILSITIPLPDADRLRSLTAVLAALDNKIGGLIRERTCLAATRDTILPQLMSGNLRVKEAEAMVAAAV